MVAKRSKTDGIADGARARSTEGLVSVSFDAVSVRFGEVTAVDDVSFSADAGTAVALIGPNGSGKTTMLQLIAGLQDPSFGAVSRPPEVEVAYVTQHASTPSWLPISAYEIVRMGRFRRRGLLGRLDADDKQCISKAADRLEVDDLLNRTYGDLSGGQRQRIRLAQALAQEPNVLLLDEPITGLDLTSQQLILDVIDEEKAAGRLVFVTTHNLDEARHCDAVLLLNTRLVAAGAPNDVLTVEHLRSAFGNRLLGDHDGHDHASELLMFDDHGHSHHP